MTNYLAIPLAIVVCCMPLSSNASENFQCSAESTLLYSDNSSEVAMCHGSYLTIDTQRLSTWQDFVDASIYIQDKKSGAAHEYIDCGALHEKQFRVEDSHLSIRHFFTTYSGSETLPPLIETLDLKTQAKTFRFENDFQKCDQTSINKAVHKIDAETAKPFNGATYFSAVYGGFYELRNCSFSEPEKVLSILQKYDTSDSFDGEVSETLSEVISEVELIRQAVLSKGK